MDGKGLVQLGWESSLGQTGGRWIWVAVSSWCLHARICALVHGARFGAAVVFKLKAQLAQVSSLAPWPGVLKVEGSKCM